LIRQAFELTTLVLIGIVCTDSCNTNCPTITTTTAPNTDTDINKQEQYILLIVKCTRYNIMWLSLSVTYGRSVVLHCRWRSNYQMVRLCLRICSVCLFRLAIVVSVFYRLWNRIISCYISSLWQWNCFWTFVANSGTSKLVFSPNISSVAAISCSAQSCVNYFVLVTKSKPHKCNMCLCSLNKYVDNHVYVIFNQHSLCISLYLILYTFKHLGK
jgi:hypothetical protein